MATADKPRVDLESGAAVDGRRRISAEAGDGPRHLPPRSAAGESEIVGEPDKGKQSSASECSAVVDLEEEVLEAKAHLAKPVRDCRICQLSLDAANPDSGIPIELGCSCKDDLAAAHKQCAEAWFKIKGNRICEICGSTVRNIAGPTDAELMEQCNEAHDLVAAADVARVPSIETRRFLQGHRFLNFLLACMVFAFVISWLFHFNVS